jgi:hypothetical protein
MKHLGSTIQGKSKHTQTKTRQNSDDSQISRPDLRFASRKHSKTTQKGAGATTKTSTPETQDCLGHGG